MSDLDVRAMKAPPTKMPIVVDRYSLGRGDCRHDDPDIYISRPAGIVSARENNSREICAFTGKENMRSNARR